MKRNSKKLIVVPLLVSGLLGGVSEVIIPTPAAYAKTESNGYPIGILTSSDYSKFVDHDKIGQYGNWREGIYNIGIWDGNGSIKTYGELGLNFSGGTLVDKPVEEMDQVLAPYILIDRAKIPSIIQTLQKQDTLELTDLLKLLTTVSVAGLQTSDLNIKSDDQKWLSITEPNYTNIKVIDTETLEKPLINTVDVNNTTGQTVTGHAPGISITNTNTVSKSETHSAKFGMKQTISGNTSFLGIVEGKFSQEFSEEYQYSNTTQKLESKAVTISAQPVDFPVPAGQHYQADVFFQQTKKSGVVTGTSRLGAGYRIRIGTTGNDKKDQLVDVSIYKKFKVIQDLYPDLWAVLKEKGIDVDDQAKQVLYTGGIGFESLQGVQVHAIVKDLNSNQTKNYKITDVTNNSKVDMTAALKSALQMK
ncbi:ETX/MTX2 family pore-forming toxin [Bacillus thuringiensis]|nr:ETX/MTX2 family pore-forming toxin [Bacillus thuringiensis]